MGEFSVSDMGVSVEAGRTADGKYSLIFIKKPHEYVAIVKVVSVEALDYVSDEIRALDRKLEEYYENRD